MDLDLSTNGSSIKECIGKMSSGKISWMILGYSGNRTLYIVETGDNSLEDMFDEFHGSEIMYGFASVIDPNTKLKKNIYIHWQGAGAQQVMKTKSMQHSTAVRDLFKPIHVTITARDSQDLDLKEVMQKVAAASGSNYSVHSEKQQIYETKPVVKSQCNTANAIQEERRKELASLGNKKDFSGNQKNSSPQVNTSNKPFVYSKPGPTKVGTTYEKINPEKEFKSLNLQQKTTYETPARIQSENNTAEKAREERQKELSRLANRTFVDEGFQHVGTNYNKINPIAEIQQLKRQSVSTESDIPIRSPSSNYKKCDPLNEINRLRKESINNDDGAVFIPSTYKKINPVSEIQELRKSHQIADQIETVSSSVYKKINPAEEIKNLKAKSEFNFNESAPVASSYKKINPTEEIMSARINTDSSMTTNVSNNAKSSESKISSHNKFEEKKPVQRQNSARSTFEKLHKPIDDHNYTIGSNSPPYNKSPIVKEEIIDNKKPEEIRDFNKKYNSESNNIVTSRNEEKIEKKTHDEIKESKFENNVTQSNKVDTKSMNLENKDKNAPKTKNAKVIFEYESQDSDEIDFEVGDIITDIEEIDEGWWTGCNKSGKRGMFPSNYVEIITSNDEPINMNDDDDDDDDDDDKTCVNQANPDEGNADKSLTVVAVYSYQAVHDDEISFEEGDQVYNVSQIDDGWWQGETENGDKGMFPANYVMIP